MLVGLTGPRGFTAGHLTKALVAAGHEVVGISRPPRKGGFQDPAWRVGDVSDPALVRGVFDGLDALVHLAGIAHAPKFLDELVASGTRRAIFVGSTGIYTKLLSPDADTKRDAEAAIQASEIDWTIVRPTMIYGTPRDRNMVKLLRWLQKAPVFPAPGGGKTLQQPIHVDDVCAAILACLDRPETIGRVYDLAGPRALTLSEVITTAGRALGRRAVAIPIPTKPAFHVVRALRAAKLPCPVWPEQILRLQEPKSVSISAAVKDLGFSPRPFADGIAAEVEELLRP
jgi:nucleoside-diphosphate-sugar epimerase